MIALVGRLPCSRGSASAIRLLGLVALAVLAICGAACAPASNSAPSGKPTYQVPAGWRDVTPPTANKTVSYAISPDVHGLIVACISDNDINDISEPSSLWRTRDSGAHWQRLHTGNLTNGCQLALPAGGRGTIIAYNQGDDPAREFIEVSHDEGQTWKVVQQAQDLYQGQNIALAFGFMAHGIYRDGRLYVASQADKQYQYQPGFSMPAFSVSDNDGQSWAALEAAPDPLVQQHYNALGIAADYRAAGAWLRLLGPTASGSVAGQAVLEHSADGGRTWMVLGPVGPRGGYTEVNTAQLLTTPAQPARLCAAFDAIAFSTGAAARAALAAQAPSGPPPPIPQDMALDASNDSGQTWTGATVAQHRRDYGSLAEPGISMDSQGDCFIADNISQFGDPSQDAATIWRLAPGAGASPQAVQTFNGQVVEFFSANPGASGQPSRLFAVTRMYTQQPPCDPFCRIISGVPHLIWAAAP